jgi:hypothetical protein
MQRLGLGDSRNDGYSTLMLAALMILAHFSVSSATSFPLARERRGEFHNNAAPAGNALIQGIQSQSIGDCEG